MIKGKRDGGYLPSMTKTTARMGWDNGASCSMEKSGNLYPTGFKNLDFK